MKQIRLGNDITVRWSIYCDGAAYDLEGKRLQLLLTDQYGNRRDITHEMTTEGNAVVWTFAGADQRLPGLYHLTLIENPGAAGMVTVDSADAFRLVSRSPQDGGSADSSAPGVQAVAVTLQSDVNLQVEGIMQTLPGVISGAEAAVEAMDVVRRDMAQTSEGIMELVADWQEGKAAIAAALSAQGIATHADESFGAMAQKVLGIRQAVDGEEAAVTPAFFGSEAYHLLSILHNNRRADLPYMCGARFGQNTITLAGADAFLCSDGYFTTEGGEHIFEDMRSEHWVIWYFCNERYVVPQYPPYSLEMIVLNGKPTLQQLTQPIAYYSCLAEEASWGGGPFSSTGSNCFGLVMCGVKTSEWSFYQTNSPNLVSVEAPDLEVLSLRDSSHALYSGSAVVSVAKAPKLRDITSGAFCNGVSRIISLELPSLTSKTDGVVVNNCSALTTLSLPTLTMISGDTLAVRCDALTNVLLPAFVTKRGGGHVVDSCGSLTTLTLPALVELFGTGAVACSCSALTEITLPALTTVNGGCVGRYCSALTTLNLPALTTIIGDSVAYSCAALTSMSLPALTTISGGLVAYSCAALTSMSLPALTTISGGSVAYSCAALQSLHLPNLERITLDGGVITVAESVTHIYLPKLWYTGANCVFGFQTVNLNAEIHIHFGNQISPHALYIGCGYGTATANNTIKSVSVEPGFRCGLIFNSNVKSITAECLHNLIQNLGDNTGNAALALTIGATNIAKISADDIALAQAKNYTIS